MGVFGFVGRLANLIVNMLLLPLSIYAVMQIMGWDWVKAGVAALIIAYLPIIGLIGNLVLAFAGGYFVIMNWPNLF